MTITQAAGLTGIPVLAAFRRAEVERGGFADFRSARDSAATCLQLGSGRDPDLPPGIAPSGDDS